MDAVKPNWPLPIAPENQPGELNDDAARAVADVAVPATEPVRVRSVPVALIRNGFFIVITILAILFALPAALGAAGPAVVGG